jgi:ribosomal protein L1
VEQTLNWLNVDAIAYTLKENDSGRFRATIELKQNLNFDIQQTSQRPD